MLTDLLERICKRHRTSDRSEHVDLSQYIGKWIAISDGEVIAHDSNIDKMFEEAETKTRTYLVTYVSDYLLAREGKIGL